MVIHVPRSFYFNMQIRNDDHDPSPEERQVMAERTERQIRTAVALVLPAADSWKVEVDTIPDDIVAQPAHDSSQCVRSCAIGFSNGRSSADWAQAYRSW